MAPTHIFSAVFLLFLSSSSYYSRPVHARQSNFFSNTPQYAPAPAPGPPTAPVPTQVENNGYGLYGSESEYSNTVTPQKEFTNKKFESEVTLSESSNINEEMLSEDESLDKEQSNHDDFYNNNENGYFDKSSVTNSDNEGQAGMSDTRYMESGKYYYDIKSDQDLTYQNNNAYTTSSTTSDDVDESIDPEVYGSSNEYFNPMEDYYRSHSYHKTKEQQYVP